MSPRDVKRQQATARRARHSAEMRKLKMVPRQVWAHLDDWPDVVRYVLRKNRERLKP